MVDRNEILNESDKEALRAIQASYEPATSPLPEVHLDGVMGVTMNTGTTPLDDLQLELDQQDGQA